MQESGWVSEKQGRSQYLSVLLLVGGMVGNFCLN